VLKNIFRSIPAGIFATNSTGPAVIHMMLASFLILYQLFCNTEGAPAGTSWQPPLNNLTALQEERAPAWVPGPQYRGTWGVLYSCTLTLGLCVYTAIHLNIPAYGESRFSIYRRKTKWVLITLIAPEFVLYTAWWQWNRARQTSLALNKIVRYRSLLRLITKL
jgi:hypothetical protein